MSDIKATVIPNIPIPNSNCDMARTQRMTTTMMMTTMSQLVQILCRLRTVHRDRARDVCVCARVLCVCVVTDGLAILNVSFGISYPESKNLHHWQVVHVNESMSVDVLYQLFFLLQERETVTHCVLQTMNRASRQESCTSDSCCQE